MRFYEGERRGDRIFTLRLITEKCLAHPTPPVLRFFLDYEQPLDSADKRALERVLSLYGIPD